jgi:hypothetical protein
MSEQKRPSGARRARASTVLEEEYARSDKTERTIGR